MPEHPSGALHTGNIADELAHGQVNLHVVVVSPTRPIFKGEAHWVTVPGVDGQLGIWPRHAPIVVALGSGFLRIRLADRSVIRFGVHGGFLECAANQVTILVDAAVAEADVQDAESKRTLEAEAKRDLQETLAALMHPRTDAEFVELLEARGWSQTRLTLAKQ